jgi:hypothetical protein
MRRLLLLALLLCPVPAWAQSFVQGAANSSGGGSGSATVTSNVGTAATGDFVACALAWYLGSFSTITDSVGGNTWTLLGAQSALQNGSSQFLRVYVTEVAAGGANFTVTFTASGTGTYPSIACGRFTGATAWTLDQTAADAPAPSATSGSSGATGTRTSAAELMIGAHSNANTVPTTITAGSNVAWTMAAEYEAGATSTPVALEYFFAVSAGTQGAEFSWTGSTAWAIRIGTYSYTTAGGATPCMTSLLGVWKC